MEGGPSELSVCAKRPLRIVEEFEGMMYFIEKDFQDVLSSCKDSADVRTKWVIVSGIGFPAKDRTLFLNLLILYNQENGEGNWFSKLEKRTTSLEGFPWEDKVKGVIPNGIYLWPEVLTMETSQGKMVSVLVMDIFNDVGEVGVGAMEQVVYLMSSIVMDVGEASSMELFHRLIGSMERRLKNASGLHLPTPIVTPLCSHLVAIQRNDDSEKIIVETGSKAWTTFKRGDKQLFENKDFTLLQLPRLALTLNKDGFVESAGSQESSASANNVLKLKKFFSNTFADFENPVELRQDELILQFQRAVETVTQFNIHCPAGSIGPKPEASLLETQMQEVTAELELLTLINDIQMKDCSQLEQPEITAEGQKLYPDVQAEQRKLEDEERNPKKEESNLGSQNEQCVSFQHTGSNYYSAGCGANFSTTESYNSHQQLSDRSTSNSDGGLYPCLPPPQWSSTQSPDKSTKDTSTQLKIRDGKTESLKTGLVGVPVGSEFQPISTKRVDQACHNNQNTDEHYVRNLETPKQSPSSTPTNPSAYSPPKTSTQFCNEQQSQSAGQTITNMERGQSAKPLGSTLHSLSTGADKQPTIVESTSYTQVTFVEVQKPVCATKPPPKMDTAVVGEKDTPSKHLALSCTKVSRDTLLKDEEEAGRILDGVTTRSMSRLMQQEAVKTAQLPSTANKANIPSGQRPELPPKPNLPPNKSTSQPSQPRPSKYEETNLDIDEKISKKITEIKDMHTSLLNISKPGPFHIQLESLKKRHDEFVNRRSSEFRNFLTHLSLSDAQKEEFIKTLETSLRLAFDLKVKDKNTSYRKQQRTQESELQPGSVSPSYGKNACESPVVTLQPEIPSYGSLSPSEEMMDTTEAPVVGNDLSAEDKTVQKDGKSSEDMEIDQAPPPPPMKSHEFIQDTVSVYLEMYKEEMDRLFRSNFLPSEEAIEKRHVEFANTKIAKLFENGAEEVGAILIKKVATALNVHKEHLQGRKEFVVDSVAKYKVELEESVESWITVTIDSKNHLPNAENFLKKVFKSFCTKMSRTSDLGHLQYDAEKLIWDKVQKEGIRLLEGLQSALTKYHAEMSRKFQLFRCVNDEKFNEFHKSATDAAVKSLHHGDNWVTQKFESGLWQLRLKFEERNKKIKQRELQLAEELSNNIKTQNYHNLIEKVLKTRSFASNELKEIHNNLVGYLLKALKSSVDLNPSFGISTEDIESKLKQELDRMFTKFEKRNSMKLEKINLTLKKEIQDKRAEYNSRMDLLVTRRGKSIGPHDLEKKHDDFVEELCRSLEFTMKKMDPLLIPETPANVKKLRGLIEVDWTQVKIANNRNKEAEQQKVRDGERDLKKKEAELEIERKRKEGEDLKLKKQESVATARSSQTSASSRSSTDRGGDPQAKRSSVSSTNYTIPIIPRPPTPIAQDFPPVAIEFGFDKIRWGWYKENGCLEILKNKFGELQTPTDVGLSQDNHILIGPELDVGKPTVKFVIALAEVLMDDTVDRQYELDVNSELQLVRKEFLYGLLLGRLKYDYECQLGGIFSTAVITVPLWYRSTHRQAIKDAGIIAGFANVHLINEPTAVALCMANTGERNESGERNLILIGVQSERHFDAAVYTHSKGVVEMECSFGDLHNSASASIFPSFCRKVYNNLTLTPELKPYFDTCLGMLKKDVKENLFVRVGEIKEYKGIKNIVTSYGKPCSKHGRLEDALLKGAAEYARSEGGGARDAVNFKDVSSYNFDRYDKWDNKYINMFNYPTLCSKNMSSEHTINIRDWKDYNLCKISQTSRKGEVSYPVMAIQLPDNAKEFRQAKVGFSLDRDDILKISYIKYGKSLDYKKTNNLTFTPYDGSMEAAIISLNLDDILKGTYASLVDSFKRDKQREQLKKDMDQLQVLVDLIEPKIPGIVKKIGQTAVTNSIAEARAFLSHSKTKSEEVRSKYESLSKLASKYEIL